MRMKDYDEVVALWKRTDGIGLSESDSREGIRRYLKRNPGMCFVAKCGGRTVGALLCGHDGRRGYLTHMAVAGSHRRRGIGTALVERALAALRREGIGACNLFIWHSNKAGHRFWESLGWKTPDTWGMKQRRLE